MKKAVEVRLVDEPQTENNEIIKGASRKESTIEKLWCKEIEKV